MAGHVASDPVRQEGVDYRPRALSLWPGLDRAKLRRTGGQARRVARLVEQRTRLPPEAIVGMLERRDLPENA